jgi:preprotein translocase subunit SecD
VLYALFGMFANIALCFNLIFLIAALAITGSTLTLPGIAGIALTLGMAVDANVLIYERIKEELRLGRKIPAAVEAGYSRAMATIIDSNLTTLIGGLALYFFGTGPIRGFGVTTAIGIGVSLFTAITLTRVLAVAWIRWRKPQTLSI